MRILIPISHVPETTTKIQFDATQTALNKTGVTFVINPYDEFALSRALELQEADASHQIVVLSVGNAEIEATIRKALAVGGNEGVRIHTESKDPFFIAYQIAAYVKENPFDLIMMGKESIDFNGSEVPGMVAELLDLPFVSFATSLSISGTTATVTREIDGGAEVLEVGLPFILSAQKGLAEWRIANMRGIMAARTKKLTVLEAKPCPEHLATLSFDLPPKKSGCIYIEPKNVNEIVQVLAEKGVI